MSYPYIPNVQDEKIESLQTQYDYLKLLRLRHLQWLSSAESSRIEGAHQKIAELMELVGEQYQQLLVALEQTRETKDA